MVKSLSLVLVLVVGGCRNETTSLGDGGAALSACGDEACPAGHYCLRNCYGIPPEARPCARDSPDGGCPLGTGTSMCRSASGETVLGCSEIGRCVPLRAGCSVERPSCGCFTSNPCTTGACADSSMYGFDCPPCP